MLNYVVQPGDTLTKIAKNHFTTVEAIASANGIRNPNVIRVGQVLRIPVKETGKPTNNQVYNALVTCLDAIEALPEFKTLCELMEG